ncbi:MAG TPA: alpha-hydroxy-acid oxidizing protein [Dyella sp.]|uniref:alpha-hydroxy-acid oxidizing protein n=1 Tax=Dyella sp. TaxID=1869338 RepID=UPI002CC26F38|nr:alpha-hydroxy-acid oxidizing protein [Dyella sp.]HUB91224.1 alpha-hydroxy-acid oxidizing protein [Dyella sp.]
MHSIENYRDAARKRLPKPIYDYLEGGADAELALDHNRKVFANIKLLPRRLRDVSKRSCKTTFLDSWLSAPFMLGPTGLNGLFWRNGDIALARAAAKEGIPFVLSTASNSSLEEVAKQSDGDKWFQLYVLNRNMTSSLVQRALECDYSTLVLTVDVPLGGNRERDIRNKFHPSNMSLARYVYWGISRPSWGCQMLSSGKISLANLGAGQGDAAIQAALISRSMDQTFDWEALQWLRNLWPRKLLVKGILHPEDASMCLDLGIDAIVLSNHGGRQLDAAASPMEVLAETAQIFPGRVLIDSGFRRGSDVVKALALGASGVLIGRPVLYGLATSGEGGVREIIKILRREIEDTLCHLGCCEISELSPHHIL